MSAIVELLHDARLTIAAVGHLQGPLGIAITRTVVMGTNIMRTLVVITLLDDAQALLGPPDVPLLVPAGTIVSLVNQLVSVQVPPVRKTPGTGIESVRQCPVSLKWTTAPH